MKVSLPIQSQVDADRDMKFKVVSFFQKVGRRESFTPSLVTVAFRGWLGEDGRWLYLSMATGGGSALAVRLRESECWLMERRYSSSLLPELAEVIAAEMTSYSDPFASERYRKQTAGNLLAAGLWESLQEETMRF
ncbi:hypothetical protein [Paenibacillus sp. DS2015]|uniref:hypothetical protein n=1 Tax=Paenibacillus sp. DS2015 TaxID=3373917 RepID=UPI003D203EB4